MRWLLVLSAAFLASAQPTITARITSTPPLSAEQIAQLETSLTANPADLAARSRLLVYYTEFASATNRQARLGHVLFLLEKFPGSPIAARFGTAGADDYEIVKQAWIRAADVNTSTEAQLNAARFLHRQSHEDAHRLLQRSLDRDPANRKVAVSQGYLYAMDMLGLAEASGAERPADERGQLSAIARKELEDSRNALVIAGAGVALPNLFVRTRAAQAPTPDWSVFEYAEALMARARALEPDQPALRGPMPLIEEIRAFTLPAAVDPQTQPATVSYPLVADPQLIEKREPVYPGLAREARIQGRVRFQIVVSEDGRVENATVASGHPLLVPAATDAVRGYRYRPQLLNGQPAKFSTTADVLFTLTP